MINSLFSLSLSGIANAKRKCLLAFSLVFLCTISAHAQIITTVAGNGSAGYTGDGGPATAAEIYYDFEVATDNFGNFFISDWYSYNSVRKVDAYGIINRFAGNGTYGFSGDGGPATAAQLAYTYGLCADPTGNVYISDWGNWRIRKVNTSGIISTYAGNGSLGYSGDGGPATAAQIGYCYGIASDASGNIFFSDYYNRRIRRIDATSGIITTIAGTGGSGGSGDGGPATAATFTYPWFLACDPSGNVYVSDYSVDRIRKIDMSTGIISNYAGTGTYSFTGDGGPATAATLYEPTGIAIDGAGNLYISDLANERVRKVNTSGIITTIGGNGTWGYSGDGGPATAAEMKYPYGLAVDGSQSVYICDYDNWRIRKINGHNRAPYFTGGHSLNITVCENTIGDSLNSILPIYDSDSYQVETWSLIVPALHGTAVCGDTAASTGAVVAAHKMYYTPTTGYSGLDSFKVRIFDGTAADTTEVHVLINPTPSVITGGLSCVVGGYTMLYDSTSGGTWSSATTGVATAGAGTGVVTGIASGTSLVAYTLAATGCNVNVTVTVSPFTGLLIKTIAGTGTAGYSGDGGAGVSAKVNAPWGVAADYLGNVFIADNANNRVRKVNASGIITTLAGNGTPGETGDGGPATAAEISNSGQGGVATDQLGNKYIADFANCCIRKVSASGVITVFAGIPGSCGFTGDGGPATSAKMVAPISITVDVSGNVYFTDYANSRVRKVNTSGVITTVAGIGSTAFSGDGSAATLAAIGQPWGVTTDLAGNIYVSDVAHDRVRKINTSGIINTYAGSSSAGYGGDGSAATAASLNQPTGIVMDGLGNLFIADLINNRIRKVTSAGIISTVVGNGTGGFGGDACIATGGVLNNPTGVAVDGNGNLYIADQSNNRVREVTNNHAPVFSGGHVQTLSICQNTSYDSINSLLSITDADNNQGETWAMVTGPSHGTANVTYSATTSGGTITPTGLWYTPTFAFAGRDSFKVQVTDCSGGTDTTWIKVQVNLPAAPITGTLNVCVGLTTTLSDAVFGGTWSSTNPGFGSIGSATGVVTGIAAGTTTITYSPGAGCTATVSVTVNAAPAPVTGNPNICIGLSNTLADATTGGSWGTSSSIIEPVTSGVVSGSSLGVATISYTVSGCPSFMVVTVNPLPSGITGIYEVCVGSGITLIDGGGGTWTSSNPAAGTIDASSGILYGINAGYTTVTYTLPTGCTTTAPIEVDGLPASVTGTPSVCIGDSVLLSDATPGGLWSSPGTLSAGTVDLASGWVKGISLGTATISYVISYSSGLSCASTFSVSVNASPSVIVGLSQMCVGTSDTLRDSVGGGAWTSSNSRIATINGSTGVITADSAGVVTITYGTGSCSRSVAVTVNALPAAILGPNSVCIGLTATETDITTGGSWSISPTTTGTISSGGVVRGIATGIAVVSYTSSGGCSAIKIMTMNTIPLGITGTLNVCVGATTALGDGSGGGVWSSSAPTYGSIGSASGIVTGIASGPTTITYSLGAGCSTTANVTVNPLPAAISGTVNVCVGSTINLTDASGGGTWTSNNTNASVLSGTVTGATGGTDVITYTLPTGCSATKAITINALPGAISGPTSVCSGGSISLSDGGIGTWTVTGPATIMGGTGLLTATAGSGTALVTYTLAGTGCARTIPVTVNPLPATITGTGSICPGGSITLSGPTGGAWSSSSTTVNSSTGAVTGSTAGTPTITYTLPTGCYRTATITINPTPPLPGGPSALCVGAHITLTESGGGTWLSGSTGVVTIGATTGNVTGIATGTSNITFTSTAGCPVTTTVTVSLSPTAITGPSGVCAGAAITLTDTVGGGLWSTVSSSATVGSLSGIVSGSGSGTAMITYSLGSGCTVTKAVAVSAAPAAILGSTTICVGTTTPLTDATTGGTWSITPATTGTISTSGVVMGIAAGTAYVNYSTGGCSVNDTVTVNTAPTAIGGPASVCQGATVIETDGTTGGAWSTTSSNISIDGTTGSVLGISAGTAAITCSIGSCTVNRTLLINPSTPITGSTGLCVHNTTILSNATTGGSWAITPATTATITGSASSPSCTISGVAAGAATVTYTTTAGCKTTTTVNVSTTPSAVTGLLHVCVDGTITLTDSAAGGVWSDITPAIIFLGSSDGLVTGLHPGTQLITYSLGTGCSVNVTVTVDTPPAAISGTMNVCAGLTTALADFTPGGGWSSGTSGTATVDSRGVVTGVSAGIAVISYLPVSGCAATANVTVNPLPNNITGTMTVCEGLTTTLTDTATGGTWSTGSSATAIVGSTTGVVTGGTTGTAIITYTLPTGCAIATSVYVNTAPVAITGITNVCLGSGTVLSDASGGGTWSTPTTGVIILGSTGSVTGTGLGSATVSYTIGGCAVTETVNVNSLPAGITGSNHVCADSRDTLADATTGGVWSSSNPLVAAIGSATGEVTGVIPGTVTVSYSMGVGCTVNKSVSVSPLPASITGPEVMCMGGTVTLHDATTGGSWSSSTAAITTVTTSGVVNGISGGMGIISYTSPATGCASVYPVSVIEVPAITGVHNICAWGDTMTIADALAGASWTSTLVTVSDSAIVLAYAPGTATITYTESHGCFVTATLTVNPLPAEIAGNPRICEGSTVTLTDATTGGSWSSGTTAVATVPPTSGAVTGVATGSSIITYTLPITGCRQVFTVTVQIPPSAISGTANLCAGATTILGDTASGGAWSSGSTAVATIDAASGIVHGINAGTTTITYTMGSLCTATAIVTVNALPTVYTVTGGGNYCSSGTGVHVGLSNSGAGINYQLYDGSIATGAATAGTGHVLDLGLLTGAGVYTVMATNSSTSCAGNMAGSATITITPSVTPIMNITAIPGTTLCAGTAVNLSSLTTNGGTTPQYQWAINGTTITGATSTTYSYTPSAGDVITAVLTSDAQCATPASVSSNTVTMTVNPELTPVTVITASPGSPILIGETETFTASVTNGGTGTTYQWKINGTTVPGATNASYVTTNISNGDTVTCVVTSGTPCGGNTASSNKVGITVFNNVGVVTHSFTEGDITVLPNPNKGTFSIKGTIGTTDEEVQIIITDMLGQQVYSTTATTHSGILNEQVQLSNSIANGMYLLNIHTTAGNRVFHVVVEQ